MKNNEKEKNKGGRPSTIPGGARKNQISVALAPDVRSAVEDAVREDGLLTIAAYVRNVVAADLERRAHCAGKKAEQRTK